MQSCPAEPQRGRGATATGLARHRHGRLAQGRSCHGRILTRRRGRGTSPTMSASFASPSTVRRRWSSCSPSCPATLVYHLHRCVAAPVTPTEAAEMALMVYYDAVYVTDPVGTLARVTAALPLAQPCAQTSWQAPHLIALGTQLARPLVAPPALCRRHQETRSTDPVDARKTE